MGAVIMDSVAQTQNEGYRKMKNANCGHGEKLASNFKALGDYFISVHRTDGYTDLVRSPTAANGSNRHMNT